MKSVEFQRILVANRGEIASRIVRAIHELGKVALVVYAEDDRELPFVSGADEAWSLGRGDLSRTYLDIEGIVNIAREARADAIHPGYGFLAENAAFARACRESGITFIGPSAEMIDLMGHKSRAREIASKLGIPVLEGEAGDLNTLIAKRLKLHYPLLIKPVAGGGGKGMRIARSAATFEQEAREASREALSYFGSGELYVERYLEESRHLEVQVIADHRGNRVHLFERECSIQRRYQKIIEEAPSAFISEATRGLLTSAALDLISGIGYTNAGTVEFLVDKDQHFYFMEMNTRIQVEHPVTEALTGIDLVKEQICISQGHALSFNQEDLIMEGHAMEVRLYAEDPANNFLPSSGSLLSFEFPTGKEVRIDKGYMTGNRVEPWYDPMLAKLIVRGKDREDARRQMMKALANTHIAGLSTNRDFLSGLLHSVHFKENRLHTRYLDMETGNLLASINRQRSDLARETWLAAAGFISLYNTNENQGNVESPWMQIGHWRMVPQITLLSGKKSYLVPYRRRKGNEALCFRINGREIEVSLENRQGNDYRIRVNGKLLTVWGITDQSEIVLDVDGRRLTYRRPDIPDHRFVPPGEKPEALAKGEISAPLNGRVVEIPVREGDRVEAGMPLVVIESMKMENKLFSDREALVKQIKVSVGQQVRTNQILLTLASI